MAALQISAKRFNEYWQFGKKHTNLTIKEASSLSISYKITISLLYLWKGF